METTLEIKFIRPGDFKTIYSMKFSDRNCKDVGCLYFSQEPSRDICSRLANELHEDYGLSCHGLAFGSVGAVKGLKNIKVLLRASSKEFVC